MLATKHVRVVLLQGSKLRTAPHMCSVRGQRLLQRDLLLRQPQHAVAPRDLQETLLTVVYAVLRFVKCPSTSNSAFRTPSLI